MIELQYNNDITREQWLSNRFSSLGASETSAVSFGSPYTSNIEIYYSKITGIKKGIENIRTYIGRKSEDITDQFYPYYEGTEESIYINEGNGRILRKIENRNVTGRNSKFPHITATPDRFLLPFGLYTGKKEGLVEYKNTNSYVLKQYLPLLPLDNIIQLLTQLNVFELDYGELFYFIDNRRYELHEMFAKDYKRQWDIVLERTTDFWERVTKGRILYNQKCEAQRKFNMKLADELDAEIQLLEPPVQHSSGYLRFINENYKSRASLGSKQAEAAEIQKALKYKELAKKIDKLEKEKQGIEIDLKRAMNGASILSLGNIGDVSWQQYENRKVFKINIKK
jgi:hypothetical protein